jgi:hypothetical protein
LAQKYKDEIIWRNELMIKILASGFEMNPQDDEVQGLLREGEAKLL